MKLDYVKWVAAAVLLLLTAFFAFLPLCFLSRIRRNQDGTIRERYSRVISLLSCGGGGVFLGTCLLHLFPEVEKQMTAVFSILKLKAEFPVAEFLLASGFILILVIEQVVLAFKQQSDSAEDMPFLGHQHSHSPNLSTNISRPSYGTVPVESAGESTEKEMSFHKDQSSHSHLRSAVLVLALSLHSMFEGLAIGLQSSSENVVRILVAVLIHKSIIAFTLGLNLTHSKFKRNIIVRCVSIFSVMSPLGTVVGSLISDAGTGLPVVLASAILQGIAAGTFVYVTFFEVLPHELNSKEDKMAKIFCLILGFSAISLLVLYVPS